MFFDLFKDYLELKAETLSSCCFINDGKGGFIKTELPDEIQLAPVFSFAPYALNGETAFLATGNFYGVIPYEGRYDALLPTVFSYNKAGNNFKTGVNIPSADGEMRDAKWLKSANGKQLLMLAGNNSGLLFYKPVE